MFGANSVALGLRISLGLMFLGTGSAKAFFMHDGFVGMVTKMPNLLGMNDFVVSVLPWAEMLLGLLLLIGAFTFWAALGAVVTLILVTLSMGFFGPGISLPYHVYALLTAISLAFGGRDMQSCCALDNVLWKKAMPKEKIKV